MPRLEIPLPNNPRGLENWESLVELGWQPKEELPRSLSVVLEGRTVFADCWNEPGRVRLIARDPGCPPAFRQMFIDTLDLLEIDAYWPFEPEEAVN
jgi:hypothetical protein